MGKALLILVLGAGLLLAIAQVGTNESLVRTSAQQGQYGNEVVAREIARSGFNVAMGLARQYGSDIYAAVTAINGGNGELRREHQGGEYVVEAFTSDGFTINVRSTGYFGGEWVNGEYVGGGTHVMQDRYQVPVLRAKTCSTLHARYIESEAGYCSGVYLQRHLPGATELSEPEMIFPVGHNGDNTELRVDKTIAPGTQMDFFIGVDENCSERPSNPRTYDVEAHVFDERDYNHIHHGIEYPFESFEFINESIWSFINQHPTNNQKWRIGWEDQHILRWDNENSTDPRNSLQALKRYGYDGIGWPVTDANGYPDLRDYGDRPDFSDQVIEVWLEPIPYANWPQSCHDAMAAIQNDDDTDPDPGGGEEPGDGGGEEPGDGGETGGGDDDGGGGEYEGGGSEGGEEGGGSSEPPAPACACPSGNNNNKKIAVMHYPPGNPGNAHIVCINQNGWNGHKNHDRDYITCIGN